MPRCENCDSFVTQTYVRVFGLPGEGSVRVCPNCEDIIRDGTDVRPARSRRG